MNDDERIQAYYKRQKNERRVFLDWFLGQRNARVKQFERFILSELTFRLSEGEVAKLLEIETGLSSAKAKIMAQTLEVCLDNPLTIDYAATLSDMIAAGHYDRKDDRITVEHFPVRYVGTVDIKSRLVHFERGADGGVDSHEVVQYLMKLNLVPSDLEHLLAFGSKYPDLQREFPIVALGSVWIDPEGNRCVPCLGGDDHERSLVLRPRVPCCEWLGSCRFLADSE